MNIQILSAEDIKNTFNNTLFDGELIKNNEDNWVYVITDIISYNNEFVIIK